MNSIVHGVAKSWIRLTDFHFHYILKSESVMPPALFFSSKLLELFGIFGSSIQILEFFCVLFVKNWSFDRGYIEFVYC